LVRSIVMKGVEDGDVRVDFDGLAVEDGGAVAPFADCGERGLVEEWIARDDFQGLDGAVGRNDGVQFDAAFAAELFRQSGIEGVNATREQSRLDRTDVHADFLGLFRRHCRNGLVLGRRERAGDRRSRGQTIDVRAVRRTRLPGG
jgi:hypothetical protein